MHVSGKKVAIGGAAMALAVLCIALSGVLEFNTLFLLAAASFLVGVMIREGGLAAGLAFYIGTVALGFLLAPNKLYCVTFAAMGFYILGSEWMFRLAGRLKKWRKGFLWIGKFLLFNLMYLPALFCLPKLIFMEGLKGGWLWAAVFIGQAVLVVYDWAYEYFLTNLWEKFRIRLGLGAVEK